MSLGDGIRRNIRTVSDTERDMFRDAIIELVGKRFPGNRTDFPAGGVSYWFKQDEIHQATHVHGEPAFLPWHRELCNRFEAMLREVKPELSLHYWDWNTDPDPLFTDTFMGNANGQAGEPWLAARLYDPEVTNDNYRSRSNTLLNKSPPSYKKHANPADPPKTLTRAKQIGAPKVGEFSSDTFSPLFWPTDDQLVKAKTFQEFNDLMQGNEMGTSKNAAHALAHGYIGGDIGEPHTSFRDPFIFLLHSNVDRLWAMWQTQAGRSERLDPTKVYLDIAGKEDSRLSEPLQPWAGEDDWKTSEGWPVRPWYAPENEQILKTCKDVVAPPAYDTTLPDKLKNGPGATLFGKYQRKCAVFARGTDNLLWYRKKDNVSDMSEWSPWRSVEGEITSNPAAATFGEDYLVVFARRTDNALWYRIFDGDNWADWMPLEGVLTSGPGATSFGWNQSKCAVFGRGTDNMLWYRKKDNVSDMSDWSPWRSVEGEITSNPAAATFGEDYLVVFALRTDNALWYRIFDGNNWEDWMPLGGELR